MTCKAKNKYASGGILGYKKNKPADGGVVVGKGTGTSDSIPVLLPNGTEGRFSNGEAVLPADTVQAIGGPAAVKRLIDRTHTPVDPAKPNQYANGSPGLWAGANAGVTPKGYADGTVNLGEGAPSASNEEFADKERSIQDKIKAKEDALARQKAAQEATSKELAEKLKKGKPAWSAPNAPTEPIPTSTATSTAGKAAVAGGEVAEAAKSLGKTAVRGGIVGAAIDAAMKYGVGEDAAKRREFYANPNVETSEKAKQAVRDIVDIGIPAAATAAGAAVGSGVASIPLGAAGYGIGKYITSGVNKELGESAFDRYKKSGVQPTQEPVSKPVGDTGTGTSQQSQIGGATGQVSPQQQPPSIPVAEQTKAAQPQGIKPAASAIPGGDERAYSQTEPTKPTTEEYSKPKTAAEVLQKQSTPYAEAKTGTPEYNMLRDSIRGIGIAKPAQNVSPPSSETAAAPVNTSNVQETTRTSSPLPSGTGIAQMGNRIVSVNSNIPQYTDTEGKPTSDYMKTAQYQQGIANADRISKELSGHFNRYLQSGDLEGAMRTARTPAEQAQVGALQNRYNEENNLAREKRSKERKIEELQKAIDTEGSSYKPNQAKLQGLMNELSSLTGQQSQQMKPWSEVAAQYVPNEEKLQQMALQKQQAELNKQAGVQGIKAGEQKLRIGDIELKKQQAVQSLHDRISSGKYENEEDRQKDIAAYESLIGKDKEAWDLKDIQLSQDVQGNKVFKPMIINKHTGVTIDPTTGSRYDPNTKAGSVSPPQITIGSIVGPKGMNTKVEKDGNILTIQDGSVVSISKK